MSKVFDENLSCPDDVQSFLRKRIAAVISGVDDWRGVTDPMILADAVIAELKSPQPCRNCGCLLVRDWTLRQDDD